MATTQELEKRIQELEKWQKAQKKQQVNYPIDGQSLAVLFKYVVGRLPFVKNLVNGEMVSLGHTTIVGATSNVAGTKTHVAAISVGEETATNQGGDTSSLNTQVYIEDQPDDASLSSFIYAYRKPFYVPRAGSTFTFTSGNSTVTDSSKDWDTNELAGAFINVYDSSGVQQYTRQIASNTATVVTIDGTWPATVTDGTYIINMPVYLGASQYPYRQGYFGGDDVSSGGTGAQRRVLRFGYGATSGEGILSIYYGTGSPESVVTARIGSLYLRTDGSTSTTLYIKTSGTGNTGWTAK